MHRSRTGAGRARSGAAPRRHGAVAQPRRGGVDHAESAHAAPCPAGAARQRVAARVERPRAPRDRPSRPREAEAATTRSAPGSRSAQHQPRHPPEPADRTPAEADVREALGEPPLAAACRAARAPRREAAARRARAVRRSARGARGRRPCRQHDRAVRPRSSGRRRPAGQRPPSSRAPPRFSSTSAATGGSPSGRSRAAPLRRRRRR